MVLKNNRMIVDIAILVLVVLAIYYLKQSYGLETINPYSGIQAFFSRGG